MELQEEKRTIWSDFKKDWAAHPGFWGKLNFFLQNLCQTIGLMLLAVPIVIGVTIVIIVGIITKQIPTRRPKPHPRD